MSADEHSGVNGARAWLAASREKSEEFERGCWRLTGAGKGRGADEGLEDEGEFVNVHDGAHVEHRLHEGHKDGALVLVRALETGGRGGCEAET